MPKSPQPPHVLLLQLIRLARARFDMRCSDALTYDLEPLHDDISPRAYGLFTGIAVSYARPFCPGKRNSYGSLEKEWSKFDDRDDFKTTHVWLIDVRNTLLAHNDLSRHRLTLAWPEFVDGLPAIAEARSAIDAAGVTIVRELCRFQEVRFERRVRELSATLQPILGWKFGTEVDLDAELARARAERASHSSE